MSRQPVPVGTRMFREGRGWQVKGVDGRWRWEAKPKPDRRRKGRVVAFEVTHAEWEALQDIADSYDWSVARLARFDVLRNIPAVEESNGA